MLPLMISYPTHRLLQSNGVLAPHHPAIAVQQPALALQHPAVALHHQAPALLL